MIALCGGQVISEPYAEATASTVIVDGDAIVEIGASLQVPSNATILDCGGCTILAGFWNCHVHFFERKWADAAAIPREELEAQLGEFSRFGFTTVFDLSSDFANTGIIRQRIDSGEVRGPRILTTGAGIVPAGYSFPDIALALLGQTRVLLPAVANAEGAREAATSILEQRVDAIKLFASVPSGGSLSAETMGAAVAVAHGAGVRVFVHPNTSEDIERAIEAGVDIVAHTTPRSGPWNPSLIEAMKESDVAVIPTLALWKYFARHDRLTLAQQQIQTATAQLRVWHEGGGAVLFGTDWGTGDSDPRVEYALMHGAGMDFDALLASLTTIPAARFGYAGRVGKVLAGMQADLAVVRGDPSADISTLSDIKYTLRAGVLTDRGAGMIA